ncbi:MAG TPA: LLM class flavin-dependent oxidoreductase, partial [Actinomycetales bacterium]|nr:LLM class flavin-dependent oxidoreductase [Actinomycetales bacterium]
MTRPFRFGVMVNHSVPLPSDRRQWQSWCRHAEQLGFSSIVLSDHLWPQLAPVPAMLSAAEATSSAVRVGALMFGNDYRHPVVLAKEVASLDVLTDGRVEVGVGAGWNEADYRQGGFVLDRPGTRVDRLAESLQVLKGL